MDRQHNGTDLVSLLLAVGEGAPLWQCLDGKSRAALRATCKAIWSMSYDLITVLESLHLGKNKDDDGEGDGHGSDEDEGTPGVTSIPAEWSPEQHCQTRHAKCFLQSLCRLESVCVSLSRGGMSQLVQLAQQGCFSTSLRKLHLTYG